MKKRNLLLIAVLMGGHLTALSLYAENCVPTQKDSLGPYYISSTPVVTNLNRFGKPGETIRISGMVRSAQAERIPIPQAKIEIWQTDNNGKYYPLSNGDYSDYKDSEIDLRGTVITNPEGEFSVLSVSPSEYSVRPAHIHYRISAHGYHTLITQHYVSNNTGNSCHSAKLDRTVSPMHFPAPTIYLRKKG